MIEGKGKVEKYDLTFIKVEIYVSFRIAFKHGKTVNILPETLKKCCKILKDFEIISENFCDNYLISN